MKASVWKKEVDLVHYVSNDADGVDIPDALIEQYEKSLAALLAVADQIEDIADDEYTRRARERTAQSDAAIKADNELRRAQAYARRSALAQVSQ